MFTDSKSFDKDKIHLYIQFAVLIQSTQAHSQPPSWNPAIAEASHQTLFNNRDLQYMKVWDAFTTLRTQHQDAQQTCEDLKIRFDTLDSTSVDPSTELLTTPPNTDHLRVLDPDDYPSVKFWTEDQFSTEEKARKSSKGKATMSDLSSKHKDGNSVSGKHVKTMRTQARRIWAHLHSVGKSPEQWGSASSVTTNRDGDLPGIEKDVYEGQHQDRVSDDDLGNDEIKADDDDDLQPVREKRPAPTPLENELASKKSNITKSKPAGSSRPPTDATSTAGPSSAPVSSGSSSEAPASSASTLGPASVLPPSTSPSALSTSSAPVAAVSSEFSVPAPNVLSLPPAPSVPTYTPSSTLAASSVPAPSLPPCLGGDGAKQWTQQWSDIKLDGECGKYSSSRDGRSLDGMPINIINASLTRRRLKVENPLSYLGQPSGPTTRTEFLARSSDTTKSSKTVYIRAANTNSARNFCLKQYIQTHGKVTKEVFDKHFAGLTPVELKIFTDASDEAKKSKKAAKAAAV
ncbi:hypothetical protein B0H12DRAFT_1228739 [Mycena haematopus]|nr:hypothetical protein B0H12DRAFT_1228739 [Mycena haematopus]